MEGSRTAATGFKQRGLDRTSRLGLAVCRFARGTRVQSAGRKVFREWKADCRQQVWHVSTPGDASRWQDRRSLSSAQVSSQGELVLTAANASEEVPARISLRLVAEGDRMVTLYERRVPTTDPATERFARIAEVGSTRKGGNFGKGTSFPECVVTGGHGEITVEYKGQKYFVWLHRLSRSLQ